MTAKTATEMAKMLEEFAKQDPESAMRLAMSESNRVFRTRLRNAVLRGWAATSLKNASDWATALPAADRIMALQEVFAGATQITAAAQIASQLCLADPTKASAYGHALIAGLAETGSYEVAAQFALDHPAQQSELLNSAYYEWAQYQPQQALSAVKAIADPAARAEAMQGLWLGWSAADPSGVALYAAQMSAGEDRTQALAEALPRWVDQDPSAASSWINQFGGDAEFDQGRAAIAASSDVLSKSPQTAATWASGIVDPELRDITLQAVLKEWATKDSGAAHNFIQGEPTFKADERASLLNEIARPKT